MFEKFKVKKKGCSRYKKTFLICSKTYNRQKAMMDSCMHIERKEGDLLVGLFATTNKKVTYLSRYVDETEMQKIAKICNVYHI